MRPEDRQSMAQHALGELLNEGCPHDSYERCWFCQGPGEGALGFYHAADCPWARASACLRLLEDDGET